MGDSVSSSVLKALSCSECGSCAGSRALTLTTKASLSARAEKMNLLGVGGRREPLREEAYAGVRPRDVTSFSGKRRWVSARELRRHSASTDCWLAVCGRVFDVTSLVATSRSPLTEPLLQHAGRDVSEWFDPETLLPLPLARVYANCDEAFKAFKPGAPFLHCIGSGFQGTPWWQDERLVIGRFASEVETLKVLNTLTGQLVEVEAPSDAPLGDVVFQELLPLNSHVEAYTLSCLGRALDLSKTLSENGLETNQKALKQHDLPWKELTPSILLHFTGDLSTKQFSE